jgi:hypothetical protein
MKLSQIAYIHVIELLEFFEFFLETLNFQPKYGSDHQNDRSLKPLFQMK